MAAAREPYQPTRTCVGCKQACAASELVRLRLGSSRRVVVASRHGEAAAASGRGAWIHAAEACVDRALKAKAFGRAFRGACDPGERKDLIAAVLAARAFQ